MVDFSKSLSNKRKNKKLSMFDMGSLKSGSSLGSLVTPKITDETIKGLNPQQKDMVVDIANYLKYKKSKKFFLVQGGGGTGKSYSINRALQGINPDHIIAAAPSHFAKIVLQNFLGPDYTVITNAALLGKKVTFNENGEQILVRINKNIPPPISRYQIVLLDEGSMLDDDIAEEILSYTEKGNKALIILGDYCQLPPVNQDHDSIFFENISAELTIPMRFQGPLYTLTNCLRDEIIKIRKGLVPTLNIINLKTDRESLINEDGSGYIFLNSMGTMLAAAIRRFKKGRGTNYVRLLAYRNKTIEKLNRRIRIGLYGDTPKQFEDGELLINNGGYSAKSISGKMKQIITNGELYKVKSATPIIGPYDIPCMSLHFYGRSFNVPILTVAKESQEAYDNTLARLTRIAKGESRYWKDVFAFKESFAYFNYSYAASIHKAQGSSINHVFIVEDDVLAVKLTSTKEKLQSMYVAISRASYRAYIYNKNFKVNNKPLNKEALKKDVDEE